jgi:rhamnogalacturonyl hydrolase YesR
MVRIGLASLFILLPLAGPAQLAVRNAVSTAADPVPLVDGLIGRGWQSFQAGDAASFLLEDPIRIEAEFVYSTGNEAPAAYRLLSSQNYRDWDLRSEGFAQDLSAGSKATEFVPGEALYLRFVSLYDDAVSWELQTGEKGVVEDWLLSEKPFEWGDTTDPAIIAEMLDRAFEWQHANPTTIHDGKGWITGAFYSGVGALFETTKLAKYRQAILDHGNASAWTLHNFTWGKTFYHADNQCIGQTWLELYLREYNPSPLWIADLKDRIDRIMADPLPGREDYSWCDALYMAPPNYVRLATVTGDDQYRTFIDAQWWDVVDFLYDREYHLFYRDSNFFDDREPNGLPVFWGRGNGWVAGGTVRMLQYMPGDWPTRPDYENLLREMAAALAAAQGEDGLWSSSLLYPEKFDYERETSGSAFFTYAMAWGVNNGILDATAYGPVIEKAWAGLSTMLTAAGTLKFIQQQGNAPAPDNGELLDKDYGYGAFLLAGTEMIKYFNAGPDPQSGQAAYFAAASPVGDPSSWTLVEDFEGGFNWTVRKTLVQSEILQADPSDPGGSRVFSINTGNRTTGVYRATKAIPPVGEGDVATVYQRFSYNNPEIDVVFGISDNSVVDAYDDYENGLRVYYSFNQLEARAGSAYEVIGEDLLQLDTWYEAWTVIDNASDTYDVYLRGGSNYPEQVLLRDNIPFRNGTSSSIVSYAISYNGALSEGSFFMDDIFIGEGVNLSRPAAVRQPAYSPWSGTGRNPENLAKDTDIGWIWDQEFPWIYHAGLGSWCYVWPEESYNGGYFAWWMAEGTWIWFSAVWTGWYYDYSTGRWISF